MILTELNRRRVLSGGGAEPEINALKFTVNAGSPSGTITLTIPSGLTQQKCTNIEYSLNGKTWVTFVNEGNGLTITTPTLNAGDSVYFRGEATAISVGEYSYAKFTTSSEDFKISASGSVMHLVSNRTNPTEYGFESLFRGCKSLTTAPELPSTYLYQAFYCYDNMFYGCTSLTTAPALLANYLGKGCYRSMFYGCTSLTTAPELPSTALAESCYQSMFSGCTGLTTAPELPAPYLAKYCYRSMFSGCTGLTTAPELPSTILMNGCYDSMFYGCSQLNKITMLATNISASGCLDYWVSNVAATGTFIKDSTMATLPTGTSGIPSGWTVEDYPN